MKDQREADGPLGGLEDRERLVKRSHTSPPPIALPSSVAVSSLSAGRLMLGRKSGAELTDSSIRHFRELDRHVQHVLCSQIMSDLVRRKISISSAFYFYL